MRVIGARYFANAVASTKPYSILFFGSEEYSRITLYSLRSQPKYKDVIKRLSVVAFPSTVNQDFHNYLKTSGIEKVTFRKQFNTVEKFIKEQDPANDFLFDLGIIASFPKKIPEKIINMFPLGMLVAHPSLLPKFRGPSPIEHTIMSGEKETGVSILEISKDKILSGNILLQKTCPVAPLDDYLTLAGKCGELTGQAIAEVLDNLESMKTNAKPYDKENVSSAPLIEKEHAILLWDKLTAHQAVKKQLALQKSLCPPFTKFNIQGKWKNVHFEKLMEENDKSTEYYKKVLAPVEGKAKPGDIHWSGKGLKDKIFIRCTDGWVSTDSIKVEGSLASKTEYFIAHHIRGPHYDVCKEFCAHFACSSDVTKVTAKIEV